LKHDAAHAEQTDDEQGVEKEAQGVGDEEGMSMRELAKLNKFGHLRWLVKAVSVRIKLHVLKENPYADFT
jgi:hypothetical protein